jgi:AcrR family transcriptional regulator
VKRQRSTRRGEPARTRFPVDERRSQLVELGLALFGNATYDELSIDAIAEHAGISKGLLYHYFPSKREFYVACVEAAAEQLLAATERAADPRLSPEARLAASLEAYFDFVDQRRDAFVSLLRSGIGVDPQVERVVGGVRAGFVERLIAERGGGPLERIAARAFVASVEAAALDWLEHGDVARERVIELLLDLARIMLARPNA